MVTFGSCVKLILLLVLQSSVCLCEEEVTEKQQTVSTSDPTISATTYTPAPQVFPQKPVNGAQIISCNTTITNPDLITKINCSNVNPNDTRNANPENVDAPVLRPNSEPDTDENKLRQLYPTLEEGLLHLAKISVNVGESTDLLKFSDINYVKLSDIPAIPPNDNNLRQILNATALNTETELIEDGQNTEDLLRNANLIKENSTPPGVPLVQGQLAAVLAGVFVCISIIGYIALLSSRRFLENRYGNRELLVDNDELNDRDDLRHFTI